MGEWAELLRTLELAHFLRHPYRRPAELHTELLEELQRRAAA